MAEAQLMDGPRGPSLLDRPALSVESYQATAPILAAAFLGSHSGHTQRAYATDLREWFLRCAALRMDPLEARRADVELWMRQLEANGRARATVGRKVTVLASFYRYGVEEGVLDRSPLASMRRPRGGGSAPTPGLDRDEARALLRAAEHAGERDNALVSLLVLNGLRVSEATSSDIPDLSSERGHRTLEVLRKGGKRERHAIAARTWRALEAHIGERIEGPLILSNSGGRLTRDGAARIVRRLARRAGIKAISPHSLRVTAITCALDAGVSLRECQDMAGHADPRTTRAYERGRLSLDRHATYTLASYLAEGEEA